MNHEFRTATSVRAVGAGYMLRNCCTSYGSGRIIASADAFVDGRAP